MCHNTESSEKKKLQDFLHTLDFFIYALFMYFSIIIYNTRKSTFCLFLRRWKCNYLLEKCKKLFENYCYEYVRNNCYNKNNEKKYGN